MSEPSKYPDREGSELPQRLADELRAMHQMSADVSIPASLDQAVLRSARTGIARRIWHRRMLRWTGAAAAAAAALFLAVRVTTTTDPHTVPTSPPARNGPQLALREDLDHSGHVDILDAFYLARQLKAQRALSGAGQRDATRAAAPAQQEWDVTGDGEIDAHDVDAIARAAVRLGGTL